MTCFAVIAGGGTAGHVLPALAIADGLVAAGHLTESLHYIGATRGIETRLVPPTGYPHTFFDVDGFQRDMSIASLRRNVSFVPKMWRARRRATRLLAASRPRVVVSVGGYASMPAVLAAQSLDIPVVVVSYDKRPGRASRVSARRAAATAAAFAGSPLPRAQVTGAPLRREVIAVDRARDRDGARARLGLPADRFVVAVTGGSQGSAALNAAIGEFVDDRRDDARLAVRHVVGERFVAAAATPRDGSEGILYQVVGYEENMHDVYAAADLVIGRGGASTVCEVAATGTPAVIVPWPAAADDHQTENARWLSDAGAAVLLPESELARLPTVVDQLRSDDAARRRLGQLARDLGAIHRSGALIELIEKVAAA
jgi:UDP-N-acetylglucosamine--N-acetylmuramyl-(pentapeptide) pyrophosphoryl-undecaprenol N-acetylglucosamine transferase